MSDTTTRRLAARRAWMRLRLRAWPILQTAGAAVAAWYLAKLLLPEDEPVFAPVAAVIALGATYGQRPERALELIGGVVLGIGVADLLVSAIGSGPWQMGLLVVLAMATAVVVGGGAVLVTEAAVSAILLVMLDPSGSGFPPTRLLEALAGGGVALAVSALAFPPNPVLMVGRSTQAIFGGLGRSLEEVADALSGRDVERASAALTGARELDLVVRELEEALVLGHETARFSPGRRTARGELDRYSRSARHVGYAVGNARVLARHVVRFLRSGGSAPEELSLAIHDLAEAVWALAAAVDDPTPEAVHAARSHASRAAARATESFALDPQLGQAEIVAQVRSTAIDLARVAQESVARDDSLADPPSEELLLDPADLEAA